MPLVEIPLLEIQPSQFYLSQEKIARIQQWFRPNDLSHFDPVPIKLLQGRVVFTDGHTRAFVAYRAGLLRIPLVWDEDELDWEAYQLCVEACRSRQIQTIAHLGNRILQGDVYCTQWNGWCDAMQEVLAL